MSEITDRSGRAWQIDNYVSPSGPAFSITVPDEPSEAAGWASNFTAHFDGTLIYEPRADRIRQLEDLAADILNHFVATDNGHRARAGQIQIARWQATLRGDQ